MKKILGIVVLGLLLSGNAYAETIDKFCLISTVHLKKEKLDPKEYKRFAGKVIKFKINLDEGLIYDVSDESVLSIISGIDQGVLEFTKTASGISYTNQFELRDKDKIIKYSYNNKISLEDSRGGSLNSKVSQSGLSLKRFNFSIPCRWYDYSDGEKLIAGGYTRLNKKKLKKGTKGIINTRGAVPKKESKAKNDENHIINLDNYTANNVDSLLYLYKARLFKNNVNNSVFLKNRNYLRFERGQQLTFEDIKELSERHFFGLPLHNSSDRDRLKKIKKEYLNKKKTIKKVS